MTPGRASCKLRAPYYPCPRGGTGRRSRLKICRSRGRARSIRAGGTNLLQWPASGRTLQRRPRHRRGLAPSEILFPIAGNPSRCAPLTAIICRVTSVRLAASSITRTRSSSSAACRNTTVASCCAAAPSNPATVSGRFRRASWKTTRRRRKAPGASRMEEALADVEIGSLLAVVHVLHATRCT